MTGLVGSRIDDLIDKHPRRCKIVGSETFGREEPDGNYSGAVGLLKRDEADFMLSESTQLLRKDFIVVSVHLDGVRSLKIWKTAGRWKDSQPVVSLLHISISGF